MSIVRKKTFTISRQVNVDDAALDKIADALGIPKAERGRITSISGEIQISAEPTTGESSGTAEDSGGSPSYSGGNPPPAGTGGTGR